jgi:hypothetical protein
MNMNPRARVWKEGGLTWGAQATCLMGCGGGAAQVDETRDSVCAFEWAAQVAGNARTHSLARAHTRMRMRMHMYSLTRANRPAHTLAFARTMDMVSTRRGMGRHTPNTRTRKRKHTPAARPRKPRPHSTPPANTTRP